MTDYRTDPRYIAGLSEVCARPDDDAPRLVVADYLEEIGEVDVSEFIRVQCELATLAGPLECTSKVFGLCSDPNCPLARREALRTRQDILYDRVVQLPLGIGSNQAKWRRGWIDALEISEAAWLRHSDDLAWHPKQCRPCPPTAHPIRSVRLTTCHFNFERHWSWISFTLPPRISPHLEPEMATMPED